MKMGNVADAVLSVSVDYLIVQCTLLCLIHSKLRPLHRRAHQGPTSRDSYHSHFFCTQTDDASYQNYDTQANTAVSFAIFLTSHLAGSAPFEPEKNEDYRCPKASIVGPLIPVRKRAMQ